MVARTKLKPSELARLWGIDVDRVLTWIRSGELRAIDASSHAAKRPRYLIDRSDIDDFDRRRTVATVTPRPRRRKRRSPGAIEFFDEHGAILRRF